MDREHWQTCTRNIHKCNTWKYCRHWTLIASQYHIKRSNEGHKIDKIKTEWKTKREDVLRWTTPDILHNQRRRILADHFPGRFFIVLIIDAHEGRDVVIFDFSGSYLNTDMPEDKFILLNIEGEFVEIMYKVNPKHKKNVRVENGVKVLYLRLIKALYGCMESALLWYDLYSKTLKSQGLLINPYYRYIENSTIQDKQCTVVWYVNDN